MHELTSTLFSSGDRFDFWRELVRGLYDVQKSSMAARDFAFQSRFTNDGSVFLSEVSCSGTTKWREKKHVSQDAHEYVKIRRYTRGDCIVVSDEPPVLLRPGATYLMKQSRVFTEISSDNHQFNVFLPAGLLGVDLAEFPSVVAFRDGSMQGAIMLAAFDALFSRIRSTEDGAETAAVTAFCNTIRELLAGGETGFEVNDLAQARRHAIEDAIEPYLTQPWEGTEELLAKLPFSRATIYRHFEEEGGVAAYLRRCRLAVAYDKLSKSSGYGVVSRVAESSGYSSVHSFHKAFKREFGATPGEVVGSKCRRSEDRSPQLSQVADDLESFHALTLAWNKVRGLR